MNQNDFVYMQVYKGALKAGSKEKAAKDAAVEALQRFKQNRLGGVRVSKLIEDYIKKAKKQSKLS